MQKPCSFLNVIDIGTGVRGKTLKSNTSKTETETETETEFIAKFTKLKKIIYNSMIVMNLAKEPGEASL